MATKLPSNLPYTKTTTFAFNGKTYTDEQAALLAAVEQAIGNPGFALLVMNAACTLAPLLARACELMPPPQPAPEPEMSRE